MKFKFKIQSFQTEAIESVVDCFLGQAYESNIQYRIDPGKDKSYHKRADLREDETGFKNADLQLTKTQLIKNIQNVQERQNLPISDRLISSAGCDINLDIEMETGTGKTYCYIKTIFEMNKRYGWSKFIIIVPSIAIREGIYKSLNITAEHFAETYGKKARFFIYNSRELGNLENFSSDAGINIMIINIQAFNAAGKDNRRIYDELDDFQSRRPIDVISNNRPILILDEPQKMEGSKTLEALTKFKPLMILSYSATHRTNHNKVYRLDALDAYNKKLVKKIAVRGISIKGLTGSNAYLYLQSIEVSKKAPLAFIEIEVRQKTGIKRIVKTIGKGIDLFVESNELDQYRGFVISQIDARTDTIEFTNGHILKVGEVAGDVTQSMIRRIQIRETIKVHLEKEQQLFAKGIKVLSLFFIDEVVKYRDYSQSDEQGEYARIFEEEYEQLKNQFLSELPLYEDHQKYLNNIPVNETHKGYFSIDKKTKKLTDPSFKKRGENEGLSDDIDAYDLILKDKERLLSFDEPARFIFSHSALREGWDNPNVFTICMLKQSNNDISRRQEVGRGLRLAVNQNGDRMDDPSNVHDINILTVMSGESYKDFVSNLQREIKQSLSSRTQKADVSYFTGKVIETENGRIEITKDMAKDIYKYLVKNDYIGKEDQISSLYISAKSTNNLEPLPSSLEPLKDQIFELIDNVFTESQFPEIDDDRKTKTNPLNANFDKKEFKELWNRINHKAIYRVDFDSNELISNCISNLNNELHVTPVQYIIHTGMQNDQITDTQLKNNDGFRLKNTETKTDTLSAHSKVKYDLLGKLAENTDLTRKTIASILSGIELAVFNQFKQNPEHFIAEASRLINEQKGAIIIEHLSYNETTDCHDINIFAAGEKRQDFTKATHKLKNHIYDYVITGSDIEREFVQELDTSTDVVVYAKLPHGFLIPTPVGDYNPDWAISFKEGSVKHIYFIAETKGSMSTMELRKKEELKIECAKKFFAKINKSNELGSVKYDVVTSFGKLMEIVGVKRSTESRL